MSELDYPIRLMKLGDKEGAIKELTKIVRSNPRNIDAWLLLGSVIDEKNKKLDCYRQVLRIDPNNQLAQRKIKELTTETRLVGKMPTYAENKNQRRVENKRSSLARFLESDRVFKLALPIMVGTLILCFLVFCGGYIGNRIIALTLPTPTRFVFPPTWTPESRISPTSVNRATPRTMNHSSQEAKAYIPTIDEMPYGFKVETSAINGAVPMNNGAGWTTLYSKLNPRKNEIVTVTYTVLIFDKVEDAINSFDNMYSGFKEDAQLSPDKIVVSELITDVDNFDGWAIYAEVSQDDLILSVLNIIRIENILLNVTTVGMVDETVIYSLDEYFNRDMVGYILLSTNKIRK